MNRIRVLGIALTVVAFCLITKVTFAEGEWATNGDNICNTNLGNVGIGTTNPRMPLEVDGFILASGSDGRLMLENPSSTTSIYLRNNGLSDQRKLEIMYATQPKVVFDNDGFMGIGVQDPRRPLEVDGIILVSGSDGRLMLENPSSTTSIYLRNNGSSDQRKLEIMYGPQQKFVMDHNGNIGIGMTTPEFKLDVAGTIRSKEVKVTIARVNEIKVNDAQWSDFVFEDGYKLPSLDHVETYIKENKHLPDVPSAKQIEEDGLSISEMMAKQMQKIEELTLYVIELKKENAEIKDENSNLRAQVEKVSELEARITSLERIK